VTPNTGDDITITALGKALEATQLQQQVIASNIANLETPGYRARHVHFAVQLKQALQAPIGRRAEALRRLTPQVSVDRISPPRADGNNVQLERELTGLTKASIHHRTLSRLLAKKLGMLERAINGGLGR